MVSDEERREQAEAALARFEGKERLRIYLIAIGGTGMAPLACLLAELGHQVSGSDGPLYPPMSDLLANAGIEPLVGYSADHLEADAIDVVVVGNAVPRHNEEVAAAEALGLPRISMPEAVGHFVLSGRRSIVATGTHGKTTTSAMAAWVLSECGQDPGYLIGGAPIGLDASFRLGGGSHFVIEGDEYNAAYFDRGPKFMHYRAHTVTMTSVEYDHVDLYPTAESFRAAFAGLVESLPEDGVLVACLDDAELCSIALAAEQAEAEQAGAPAGERGSGCRVIGYSSKPTPGAADARFATVVRPVEQPRATSTGTHFALEQGGKRFSIELGMWGEHNVANAIAVWCAATSNGCDPQAAANALSSFAGVQRRLQVLGTPQGVVVVDDFAHHPTEVAASLAGLRARYPERRLIALFEPRSLSAGRAAFADAYVEAFAPADVVLFAPVFHADRLSDDERLDLEDLCGRLRDQAGGAAHSANPGSAIPDHARQAESLEDYDAIIERALALAQPGDVIVTMSSGAFGGAPRLLVERLSQD